MLHNLKKYLKPGLKTYSLSVNLRTVESNISRELNTIQKKYKNLNLASGFGRASKLINKFGDKILLRHQADWISGWLLNDWTFGEEGNNIKLGWNILGLVKSLQRARRARSNDPNKNENCHWNFGEM